MNLRHNSNCVAPILLLTLVVLADMVTIAIILPQQRATYVRRAQRVKDGQLGLELFLRGSLVITWRADLHRHQSKNLRQVVLMDVADDAVLVIKFCPSPAALKIDPVDM